MSDIRHGGGRLDRLLAPDSVVEWMRVGRWTREIDHGEGPAAATGFPPMPSRFRDNRDFGNLEQGLRDVGMDAAETAALMGGRLVPLLRRELRVTDLAGGPGEGGG